MPGLTELEEMALGTLRAWGKRAINGHGKSRRLGQDRIGRLRELAGSSEVMTAIRIAASGQRPEKPDEIERLRKVARHVITLLDAPRAESNSAPPARLRVHEGWLKLLQDAPPIPF